MKIKSLTFLFIVLSLLNGCSQNFDRTKFDRAKLDKYFEVLEANDKFMGSVAVAQNGKIIYTKSIGYADLEGKIKADDQTKYRIGSISKTFTAILVLKAVEQKKLTLDQTIQKFFPTVKNAGTITLRNLLNHRSGIHNFTNDPAYMTWYTQPKTENELVEFIAHGSSDFEPGSKFEYSNSNFVLLTYVLEKTFKKTYAQLLAEYITTPLSLTNTYVGKTIDPANHEARSYKFMGGWKLEPETDMSIPVGAGAVVSSPGDLVKFSDALFSGKILKKESLDQMMTMLDRYGMGLMQTPFAGNDGYGHGGSIDGFNSMLSNFAEDSISYALTSNGLNFNNNTISIVVLSAVYGKEFAIPEFKTYAVAPQDLDQYLGIYSSPEFPLKITISKEANTLKAQATGQGAFPLEGTDKDKFKFDQAGVVLEFNVSEKTMLLKQAGRQFLLTKE